MQECDESVAECCTFSTVALMAVLRRRSGFIMTLLRHAGLQNYIHEETERGFYSCGELFNSNVNKEGDEQNSKGAVSNN